MFRPYKGHHQAIETMVLVKVQVVVLPPTVSRGLEFVAYVKCLSLMHGANVTVRPMLNLYFSGLNFVS